MSIDEPPPNGLDYVKLQVRTEHADFRKRCARATYIPSSWNRVAQNYSAIFHLNIMSSNRLFRFPKPEWLNSPNTRTAGVYAAGALVRPISLTMIEIFR